jgi:hypothetical protein
MADMTDMATKYWELSNQVTGFAVVQIISLVFAASTKDVIKAGIKDNWKLTVGLICGDTLVNLAILAHCYAMEVSTDPDHKIFGGTNYARMSLIILTNLFGMLWVWKMSRDQ